MRVMKNGKWGFVDPTGKVVIPLRYDRVISFNGGKARVQSGQESYYIDKKGNRLSR